ncbi:MAG: hypothetical protein LBE12_07630 [Planctomycetaceae bacterium]|jgi:hypothetical protein|nr:hypothetical protein [Planctomycetaceae bacterium]
MKEESPKVITMNEPEYLAAAGSGNWCPYCYACGGYTLCAFCLLCGPTPATNQGMAGTVVLGSLVTIISNFA